MKIFNYEQYQENIYYEKLPSGLEVYLVKKANYVKKYCQLTAKFGSTSNIKDNHYSGIAHYLEHMMFNTDRGDASEIFLNQGANINAFTSYDQTTYYFDTINDFEHLVIKLLKMVFQPTFDDKSVEKERGIILQELKMGLDNPNNRLFFETLKCLFFNHNFKHEIVGEEKDVKNIKKADLHNVYKGAYNPSNCILFIIGNIDVVKILAEIEKVMLSFKTNSKDILLQNIIEPLEVRTPIKKIALNSQKNYAALGFKLSIKDVNRFIKKLMIVLSYNISSTSKLYEFMLDNGIINTSYYYNYACDKNWGFVYICSETNKSEEFFKLIIDKLNNFTISEANYLKYKNRMYGGLLQELNSLEDYAYSFVTEVISDSNIFELKNVLEDIDIAELNDMKNEFKHYTKVISY